MTYLVIYYEFFSVLGWFSVKYWLLKYDRWDENVADFMLLLYGEYLCNIQLKIIASWYQSKILKKTLKKVSYVPDGFFQDPVGWWKKYIYFRKKCEILNILLETSQVFDLSIAVSRNPKFTYIGKAN